MEQELVGGAPGNILGVLVDLIQKYRSGGLTEREIKHFANREQPFLGKGGGFCSVVSQGCKGLSIYHRLRGLEVTMDGPVGLMFEHQEFIPTNGIRYHLATIDSEEFGAGGATFRDAITEGKNRGYKLPPVEVAPLVCEMFGGDLGRSIFYCMHKPIDPSHATYSSPKRIFSLGSKDGKGCLWAHQWDPKQKYYNGYRFIFLASQEPINGDHRVFHCGDMR